MEQLRVLRDKLAPFAEASFRSAASPALERETFVNEAIAFVLARLRAERPPAREPAWVDDELEKTRTQIARLEAQRAADKTLLATVPAQRLERIASEITSSFVKEDEQPLRRLCERWA